MENRYYIQDAAQTLRHQYWQYFHTQNNLHREHPQQQNTQNGHPQPQNTQNGQYQRSENESHMQTPYIRRQQYPIVQNESHMQTPYIRRQQDPLVQNERHPQHLAIPYQQDFRFVNFQNENSLRRNNKKRRFGRIGLPRMVMPETEFAESVCAVCLGTALELKRGKHAVVKTICGHFFCLRCISKWKRERRNCPVCRKVFLAREGGFRPFLIV